MEEGGRGVWRREGMEEGGYGGGGGMRGWGRYGTGWRKGRLSLGKFESLIYMTSFGYQ